MKALKFFIRAADSVSERVGLGVSVCLPLMVAVLTFEVVSRYLFNRPTIWAYDLAIFLFGYCGLLSGAYVLKHNAHINVDLVYSRLSRRKRAILDVITGLLMFYFLALMILYGWESAYSALQMNEHTATEWAPPVGHFKLMAPLGAFLLLIQGLANWIRSLYLAITNKELEL